MQNVMAERMERTSASDGQHKTGFHSVQAESVPAIPVELVEKHQKQLERELTAGR
jgi:hypothetical protein